MANAIARRKPTYHSERSRGTQLKIDIFKNERKERGRFCGKQRIQVLSERVTWTASSANYSWLITVSYLMRALESLDF